MSALEGTFSLLEDTTTPVVKLQAFATLALAEEQRAVNYLAMAALYPADTDSHRLYRGKAAAIIGPPGPDRTEA